MSSLDRTGKLVAFGVFVAMVVDGMDLQMLSIALPSISKELHVSGVITAPIPGCRAILRANWASTSRAWGGTWLARTR